VRLLIDANLSPRVAATLVEAGHDAVHVSEVGLLSADDTTIAALASTQRRIVVTSDSDFGTILARTGGASPSVVLLRHLNDTPPERQAELVQAALAASSDDLAVGAIVTVSKGRLRVRSLPIG
jgi:predicted nuclease of predicted toxin-antitoxin system